MLHQGTNQHYFGGKCNPSFLNTLSTISGLSIEDIDRYMPIYMIEYFLKYVNISIPLELLDNIKTIVEENKIKISSSNEISFKAWFNLREYNASFLVPYINLLFDLTKKKQFRKANNNIKISFQYNSRCIYVLFRKKGYSKNILELYINVSKNHKYSIDYTLGDLSSIDERKNRTFLEWIRADIRNGGQSIVEGLSIKNVIDYVSNIHQMLK